MITRLDPDALLIQKALTAKRESKTVEFKSAFDPEMPGEWCEVIKDIVAIANSGSGIIVFGLDNTGNPSAASVAKIAGLDPADVANRISKYTGIVDLEFTIHDLTKQKHSLVAFVIHPVSIPIVFQKPDTYDIGGGKQKTAFSIGTVYFRHGAKSEPGTSEDIRRAIERQLEIMRKSWIKGVRRVVEAPAGTQMVAVRAFGQPAHIRYQNSFVRAVKDPNATPVLLTRDRSIFTGSFIHEEVSDGIFDEINNVIDANRVLAKGQNNFLLGQRVYYRVYAERQHVAQSEDDIALLFHSGAVHFYAPCLYWMLALPARLIAASMANLYLRPVNPHVHFLMRTAVLLGEEFSKTLYGKWHAKWKTHPQPPSFYRTFGEMIADAKVDDCRLVAIRASASSQLTVTGETVTVGEILAKPEKGALLLSKACMQTFEGGGTSIRSVARYLDYLTYGFAVQKRSGEITKALMKTIGDQQAGDIKESRDSD